MINPEAEASGMDVAFRGEGWDEVLSDGWRERIVGACAAVRAAAGTARFEWEMGMDEFDEPVLILRAGEKRITAARIGPVELAKCDSTEGFTRLLRQRAVWPMD